MWDTGLFAARYPALAGLHDWWPTGGALACAADARCGAAPWGNAQLTWWWAPTNCSRRRRRSSCFLECSTKATTLSQW